MDRDDVIERYLDELDAELRLPRRVRRRIVTETREHLHDAAGGEDAPDAVAQTQAIESFGSPTEVAASFARELAIGTTRRAARHTGMLFVLSLLLWDLCTSSLVHVAPGWINDGPGSALLWIIGQAGLVAGTVSLARARVARRRDTFDSARLRYAVRGLAVLAMCTAITVLMTGTGVLIALTSTVARRGQILLAALIVACAALTAISAAGVWQAHRRLAALDREPLTATGQEALSDLADTIADGAGWVGRRVPIAAVLARRILLTCTPAARRAVHPLNPREHPWRYACAIGLLAGAAVPLLEVVVLTVSGRLTGPQLSDLAATAPTLITIEAGLVVAGYAILGGYLGLRPTRTQQSDR